MFFLKIFKITILAFRYYQRPLVVILSCIETKIYFSLIAPAAGGILQTDRAPASMAPNRFPNRDTPTIVRRPILKKKIPFNEEMRPIRRKPGFRPLDETSNPDPRFPIKNEIPDSANVRANQGPRADVPPVSAVQNERDARANSLNLGMKPVFFQLFFSFSKLFSFILMIFFSSQVALLLWEYLAVLSFWLPLSPQLSF